jgi:Disulphide bond corrector protein DsbC
VTATNLATWAAPSIRLEPAQLSPGGLGRIVVTLDVPDGCHVQSHEPIEPFLIATILDLDRPAAGIELGPVVYPVPTLERFDWTPVVLAVHRGQVEIEVPVAVTTAMASGLVSVSGRLRYQGCTATACLPPRTQAIEVDVPIVPPAA